MILSIIIISHNQRSELKRCVDSVLAQDLPFEHEIIISDDRSTDGSYELAQEYASKYPYIIATQCNSDACNPANNSHRSGYNRCNGYKYAKGKYLVHVDADDYFRPDAKVYEKQIKALEAHPECALAMSTCLCVKEGSPLETGIPWGFPRKMIEGEVIESKEFVRGDWFRLNQCFMQRRNPNVDPIALYGKRYVDSVITYHHLQFGDVVYVDACDYVYVGHEGSVVANLSKNNRDSEILWNLGVYIPVLIPRWWQDFTMGFYYSQIRANIKLLRSGYRLQLSNLNSLKNLNVWFYNCFGRKLTFFDELRLYVLDSWLKLMKKFRLESNFFVWILKKLIV